MSLDTKRASCELTAVEPTAAGERPASESQEPRCDSEHREDAYALSMCETPLPQESGITAHRSTYNQEWRINRNYSIGDWGDGSITK